MVESAQSSTSVGTVSTHERADAAAVDAAPVDSPGIPIKVLHEQARVPGYSHEGDAGADLSTTEEFTLAPGERRLVGTGVAIALPLGYVGLVHPRSGLAAKHGVTVVNAPGTVDAGYRGEIKVCLLNTDRSEPVSFSVGDRIAQLVVQRVARAEFVQVDELDQTVRGAGGHGSTGLAAQPAAAGR